MGAPHALLARARWRTWCACLQLHTHITPLMLLGMPTLVKDTRQDLFFELGEESSMLKCKSSRAQISAALSPSPQTLCRIDQVGSLSLRVRPRDTESLMGTGAVSYTHAHACGRGNLPGRGAGSTAHAHWTPVKCGFHASSLSVSLPLAFLSPHTHTLELSRPANRPRSPAPPSRPGLFPDPQGPTKARHSLWLP